MQRAAGWAALLWASALAVACVPALNTRGRIVCGDAGECPQGFECRAGRCCPSEAGASCPAEPADASADAPGDANPDALVTCDPDAGAGGGCPADNECRAGVCCPSGAGAECPPGSAGAPCTGTDDCSRVRVGGNRICALQVGGASAPGGYCFADCDPMAPEDACAPLGVCVGSGHNGVCLRRCPTAGQSCRDGGGYWCSVIGMTTAGAVNACLPDCTSTDPRVTCDTTRGYRCYRRGHICNVACTPTDGGTDSCATLDSSLACDPASNVCLQRCGAGLPACITGLMCDRGFCQSPP